MDFILFIYAIINIYPITTIKKPTHIHCIQMEEVNLERKKWRTQVHALRNGKGHAGQYDIGDRELPVWLPAIL